MLTSTPWEFSFGRGTTFVGSDMCWLVVLGLLMYFTIRPKLVDENALSYTSLGKMIASFKSYLVAATTAHEYPTVGPACKYGVASSREAYLYTIIEWEMSLVNLLLVVQRLVSRWPRAWPRSCIDLVLCSPWYGRPRPKTYHHRLHFRRGSPRDVA